MQEKICFQIDLVEAVQNPNQKVNMDSVYGELTDGPVLGVAVVWSFVDYSDKLTGP